MTNGEKIQTILDIDKDCTEVYGKNGMMTFSVPQDWWNAEYKEPTYTSQIAQKAYEDGKKDGYVQAKLEQGLTTKNDLEVDYISRQAVLDLINADWKYENLEIEINKLPSVTPKGHWTEEFNDLEGEVRFTCSSCGKYQLFGTDFCYHCGSDNREVKK